MRKRCVDVFAKFEEVEIVAPDEKVSANGLVTDEKDAKGIIDFFAEESIKGLIIGTMIYGDYVDSLVEFCRFAGIKPVVL
jgi:hypothetical protein